jgi:prolyl oligopeptidase
VISGSLTPAYAEFKAFIEERYLPNSREQPGIGSLPGGKAIYAMLARHFTTTDLTPEQIHNIGLREVARIRGEMQDVIDEVEFEGDLSEFNDFLRTDPQFYYETPEALLEGYQAVSKRLDPELVKLFGKTPTHAVRGASHCSGAGTRYDNSLLHAPRIRRQSTRLVLR